MQEWTRALNLLIIALESLRNAIETAIMAANWRMSETDRHHYEEWRRGGVAVEGRSVLNLFTFRRVRNARAICHRERN